MKAFCLVVLISGLFISPGQTGPTPRKVDPENPIVLPELPRCLDSDVDAKNEIFRQIWSEYEEASTSSSNSSENGEPGLLLLSQYQFTTVSVLRCWISQRKSISQAKKSCLDPARQKHFFVAVL